MIEKKQIQRTIFFFEKRVKYEITKNYVCCEWGVAHFSEIHSN